MAISANSLIEDVARHLSDYDDDESYVHWTREDLLSYCRLATSLLVGLHRERFIKRAEIKMVEGAIQDVPEQCESNITVQGMADKNGVITRRVRQARLSVYPSLGRPTCKVKAKSSTGYEMSSYDFSEGDGRHIIVDPPVPPDTEATLVISCYQPPTITSADDIISLGADLEAVLFEFMLYYAWSVDIEDAMSRERSVQHWNNAITLLRLDNTAEQALTRQLRRR